METSSGSTDATQTRSTPVVATSVDAAGIAALHGELFSPPWSANEVMELMSHPGAAAFVVRDGSRLEVAGFILGRVAADEAELLSIGVAPALQRLGLARRQVHALAGRVQSMGAAKLHLEVSAFNAPALALYTALGFERTGLRRGYYRPIGKPAEDAWLMALDLLATRRVD